MSAAIATADARDIPVITLDERLTAHTVGPVWRDTLETLSRHPDRPVVVDAARLRYLDNTGMAFLFDLRCQQRPPGAALEIRDLAPNLAALIQDFKPRDFATPVQKSSPPGIIEHLGRAADQELAYVRAMLAFLGDTGRALTGSLVGRGRVRWGEMLEIATEAGANAVPIVLLIGFLMGVIIAFQIGLVAQQFGAVIFVVDGVGIAMLRELGPLMTAIVFAGRTGAAFAAQIGTQKVNEEVNAIVTFGLDPIYFLVLPRIIAAALVVPLLTVLADLIGLFGGALVMLEFNVGFVQFYQRLLGAVGMGDFLIGIFKGLVFGITVAAIGCQRGLATGAGATSVGLSTTSAVVTNIVWIVVLDGLFALIFRG